MADNTIDTLDIQISSSTEKAVRALENLSKKLNSVNATLGSLNTGGLRSYAKEIGMVTSAFNSLGNIRTSGLDSAISKLNTLSKINLSNLQNVKDAVTGKLKKIDPGQMTDIAGGMEKFSNSIKTMGDVNYKGSGLNAVINSINRLSKADISSFDTGKLGEIITKLSGL